LQNQNKDQKGFLTLEIVMCLALASLFFFGTAALVLSNQDMQVDSQNDAYALKISQAGMETAMVAGFNFAPPPDAVDGNFTEHLQTNWLTGYAKEITSRVSFVSSGRPRQTELNSLVTDSANALGRDTCALGFSGSWQNPKLRGAVSNPQGSPSTDVDVNNNRAYVAVNGDGNLDDFFVVDVSNLDHPVILNSITTGPGLNAVQIAGDYAFAANSSVKGQLEIIKISDPAHPVLVQHAEFADAAAEGVGTSIYYYNGRVYVGTAKNDGPEFYIYDVSNPLAPQFLGEFEIGSQVNKIYVYGTYAYLATGDINRLRILDVSNPGAIKEVGDFSDVGGTAQSGESVAVLGGQTVFGRAGGLPGAHIPELYLLDVNHPSAIGKLDAADINMSVNDIFLRGGLAFLATNKSGAQFEVYNYSSGRLNFLASAALPSDAVGLDCDGENFFVAQNGSQILQIISAQ
jgi:hypothetical protein